MKRWQIVLSACLIALIFLFVGMVLGYLIGRQTGGFSVAKPTPSPFVSIVCVAQDIRAGQRITQDKLTMKTIPRAMASEDSILNYSDVVGSYARYNLPIGVVLTKAMIVSP